MSLRTSLQAKIVFAIVVLCTVTAKAELRFAKVFTDHAVLQRDAPISVWGIALPGSNLSLQMHDQKVQVTADKYGSWTAWFKPESAGGPYVLSLTEAATNTKLQLLDIMLGDVWIASGQSNMEFPLNGFMPSAPLKNSAAEIAAATHPELRLLMVNKKTSDFPLTEIEGSWTQCTPQTAANFSAVAYFFGREIAQKEHVTIGLIDSTWGGTPADAWVSLDELGSNAALFPAFSSRAHFADGLATADAHIAAEKVEDDEAKAQGKPAPYHMWHPFQNSWAPAEIYNGMIAPLTKYSVKGFLWYQGETNSSPDRAPYYVTLFPALIQDWRSHFQQGNLPFLFVQISSFTSPGENWGLIRDAQRRTLSLANTAMAVTLDVGDSTNVHPPDKQTVGARLALAARAMVYGERTPYQSPLFRQATSESNGLRVWFDHADGLHSTSNAIEGFELAGEDRHFVPATAVLQGTTVLVTTASIPAPRYVRYAWQGFGSFTLVNSTGLPASTFTSEEHPGDPK